VRHQDQSQPHSARRYNLKGKRREADARLDRPHMRCALVAEQGELSSWQAVPMHIEFSGTIWFWKGPAPWYFVTIPAQQCHDLKAIASSVTYGWGVIPVQVRIGGTGWATSLFPKDGRYIVPIRASVRKAERLEEGDTVTVQLEVR
jgi:hypothetical protein